MKTQAFTRYWNIARLVAIGVAFFIFVFLTVRAHAHGGFSPNLEVELDTRSEQDEKESSRQESEKNDSGVVVHFDDKGNDTIFVDGGELRGFTDYLFAYFKKDRLESVLYHGTINTLFGTRFIYTYIDNREIFTTYLIQRHIELCEWQVKSLGWDNK